jgi:hypothetical protein
VRNVEDVVDRQGLDPHHPRRLAHRVVQGPPRRRRDARGGRRGPGLTVAAHETNFQESAEDRSTLYVGMPHICTKKLTRAEYDARVAELERELRDDPDLLEKYKFDLLKCRQ